MSLPTMESSSVFHTTKSIQGFDHPEYPVIRVALEVLDAKEGYLWVRHFISSKDSNLKCFQRYIRGSGFAYGQYMDLDVEAGLLTFSLYLVGLTAIYYICL
jgi:Zn-dependent M16 (insulinase) family peptidase